MFLGLPASQDAANSGYIPPDVLNNEVLRSEEGKLWDKAWQAQWAHWQAQYAHIHTPKEGRAHPFTWAPG